MTVATVPSSARQPTIRELVGILGQRRGVEAAILLGRDGLVIESRTAPGVDSEHIAAHVPALVAAADALVVQKRELISAVLEYDRGVAVVSALNQETLLVVMLGGDAPVGPLLFELRRHRANMASIV